MPNDPRETNKVATNLNLALKRLRARLREESSANSGLSMSQLSILHWLDQNGPATAAMLASTEHVSQQAIAQNIAPLKLARLVQTKPDMRDGRKILISMTDDGHQLRESIITSRNTWLVKAIESTIDDKEYAALVNAVELMERLAEAKTK
jgi:DNA-binding MarR family transcriptional regulator